MKKISIGIALATIVLASIFGTLMPTSARTSATDIVSGDTVYIGEQGINFPVTGSLEGVPDTNTEGIVITISAGMTIPSTIKGKYFVDTDGTPGYSGSDFYVFIDEATITGDVILNSAAQDSVVGMTVPNSAEIVFKVETNIGTKIPGAMVDITVTDPDGVQVLSIDGQALSDIVILGTTMFVGNPAPTTTAPAYVDALDLNGMKLGTYKATFKLDKSSCNLLDKSSATMEFTIRSEELSIEAAEDEVSLGEDIILTVTGNPVTYYYLIVTNVDSTRPPRIKDVGDVRALSGAAVISADAPDLAAWIKTGSDGIADIRVATAGADTRTYTIKVYDAPGDAGGALLTPDDPGGPTWANDTDIVSSSNDDDVDVIVVTAKLTFDVPTKAIIGEKVEINGTISSGDKVDIIIKDEEIVAMDEVVDLNDEFSVEWDTSGYVPGSYKIEAYIDFRPGESKNLSSYDGFDPDGSTTIRLMSPGVDATQPRNVVAEGDDYTVEGTATGVNAVDYILVGPKGWKLGHDATISGGILIGATSVSDDEFSEDITMTDGLDLGVWVTLVLSPGRDGVYQTGESAGSLTLAALNVTDGKSQTQILEIIEEVIMGAGSDDLMETLSFRVEFPYVTLHLAESVVIGEPLNISGVTNREPGTTITISTIAGPTGLMPALAGVEWPTADQGIFSAAIDTTGAEPGTYIFEADDGDGNTANVTVAIEAPLYGVDLTVEGAETVSQTIYTTETATYALTAANTGNVPDSYTLTVENVNNADTAVLSIYAITNLAAGAMQNLSLTVADATAGTYVVNITATSDTDPTNVTAMVSTITTIERRYVGGGRGGGASRDSDGDGYSDIQELIAGTNPKDPKDYPGAPTVTPTPTVAPTSTATATPTPAPAPVPTLAATPKPRATPEEGEPGFEFPIPGFEAICALGSLVAVTYLVLRRRR